MTPHISAPADARSRVTIYAAYGLDGRQSSFSLQGATADTYGHAFSTPYLVLPPDHRLEVVSAAESQATVDVSISGLLVNNVAYVPVVSQDW